MNDNSINQSENTDENTQLIAAIDIGSNMIRMVIGQLFEDDRIEILETFQRAVHLGQDTFSRGRLGRKTIRAAVAILKDFKNTLDLYKIEHVRTVATSAIREATNVETFLDRVYIATNLEVQVIDISEESRLTVSAVTSRIQDDSELLKKMTLIADVGGGNTVLTVINEGHIIASQSLGLGSVRLLEALSGGESWQQTFELIKNEIGSTLNAIESFVPLKKIQTFIAVGADARFAAEQTGSETTEENVKIVQKAKFNSFITRCQDLTTEQLVVNFNLPFADAEKLNPALLIYQALLKSTKAKQMVISDVSMRNGLLLDIARCLSGKEDEKLTQAIELSAKTIAEKYKVNLEPAEKIAAIALHFFDELQSEHRLTFRHRLYLYVAALLHETGIFISNRAYHKHTYYIILHSEIFGLTQKEIELIAHIARYHRRGRPKPSHVDYVSLPRDSRVIVNKLASLLRMATAFQTAGNPPAADYLLTVENEYLMITLPSELDTVVTRNALKFKSDMFRDVYGLNVSIK